MRQATLLPLVLLLACGSSRAPAVASADAGTSIDAATAGPDAASAGIPRQIVFMIPAGGADGGPIAPGPTTIYEIAVANLDGSNLKQLTSDGKFKFLPHFSPDGTKVLYTKYAVGAYGAPNAQADVAVFDLATSTEAMVTTGGANVQGTWSPDGTQVAYLGFDGSVGAGPGAIWIVGADGSNPQRLAAATGTASDMMWGDIAWSLNDWILFSVGQSTNGCFNVRTDKILPDGGSRTQVTNGGPNCTPPGAEQAGDADPGWSHDGMTIYSSRGFPVPPGDADSGTERKLYAFSSDAWYAGKPEMDLSLPTEPSCVEGVPKGSPDGTRILLFRVCFDGGPASQGGIYLTDTAGSYRTFVTPGFGPDWNPLAK